MDRYDLLIVGAGSAGLSAGIYGARSKRSTLILDRKRPGGQAATTEKMENYPGFPGSIGGRELMERFRNHALGLGARIERAEVVAFAEERDHYLATTKEGESIFARTLILAPGCEPRRLGIPGELELSGRGVSYCATCDAELYEGATVVVVGSGDTAIEEAEYISRFADTVVMLVVHDEGVLDCNAIQAQTALGNTKLSWKWNTELLSIEGTDSVEGVRVRNLRDGKESTIACDGVFVFVGTVPQTAFLNNFVSLRNGFIETDEHMETNRSRVYAAGDARLKSLRQVVTAASDGAVAAFFADKALTEIDEYEKAVSHAGAPRLVYFYTPPVQRSLDLFPFVEQKAREEGLPLIKLDTYRYRSVAARFGVKKLPFLLKFESDEKNVAVPLPESGKEV